jgi:hypothetical protein
MWMCPAVLLAQVSLYTSVFFSFLVISHHVLLHIHVFLQNLTIYLIQGTCYPTVSQWYLSLVMPTLPSLTRPSPVSFLPRPVLPKRTASNLCNSKRSCRPLCELLAWNWLMFRLMGKYPLQITICSFLLTNNLFFPLRNCLFSALALQFYGVRDFHHSIRQSVVEQMELHPALY